MCGIVGAYLENNQRVGEILRKMLTIIYHRGPEGSGIVTDEATTFAESPFFMKDIKGTIGIGHNRLALVGKGSQPIPNESEKLWVAHNGEIYNHVAVREELEKKGHKFRTNIDSEVLVHLFEENLIEIASGDFAALLLNRDEEELYAIRDPIGIRPLYFCRSKEGVLFASERKALRPFCTEHERVLPGEFLIIARDGISRDKLGGWVEDVGYTVVDEREVIEKLKDALIEAVLSRAHDDFGILFSGGIDSTIIAKIASDYGLDFEAITVGLPNSPDIKNAREVSEKLKIRLSTYEISEVQILVVASILPRIIDEMDVMKILIGTPIFLASYYAKKMGYKVLMTGQGADELFGGYHKYLRIENPLEEMMNDFQNLYLKNLERDDHCAMIHSIEVRYPYLDKNVVTLALSLPIQFKIKQKIRKYILRKVALELGIPKEIAFREKKAIQYGTKTVDVLRKKASKMKASLEEFIEWLSLNV